MQFTRMWLCAASPKKAPKNTPRSNQKKKNNNNNNNNNNTKDACEPYWDAADVEAKVAEGVLLKGWLTMDNSKDE